MNFIKPALRMDILKKIVADTFGENPHIRRVGIVGSFARGGPSTSSDVDLVIDCFHGCENDINHPDVLKSIEASRNILEQQFIRDADFILYDDILRNVGKNNYQKPGYEQMLRDLKWIYEKRGEEKQK